MRHALEKNFDENEAVRDAMRVFWEKGYEATSLTDLLEGTGLSRGSLYNAFGGKQQLFEQALLEYDRSHRRATLAQLEALDSPQEAFETLFGGLIEEAIEDEARRGCFLVNTALSLESHEPEVQATVKQALKEFEGFFRRGIEVAQARDDMPDSIDAAATAKALLGLVVAIRVLARGAFAEAELRTLGRTGAPPRRLDGLERSRELFRPKVLTDQFRLAKFRPNDPNRRKTGPRPQGGQTSCW